MNAEKSLAIVLRTIEFSETSLVVTLLTREFGKVQALAKGARRLKGPFEGALDLLCVCRIVFLRKSSGSLDLLTEAKLERRFRAARCDLSRLYAGYYVAELLGELTDNGDPHPELFDLACNTLEALDSTAASVAALLVRFELETLRLLGHLPSLDQCVECGTEDINAQRIAFGLLNGGVLCSRCRPGKSAVVSLSRIAWETLLRFREAGMLGVLPEMDRGAQGEIRGVLNQYVSHLLGHKPRLHEFLGILAH